MGSGGGGGYSGIGRGIKPPPMIISHVSLLDLTTSLPKATSLYKHKNSKKFDSKMEAENVMVPISNVSAQ